MQPVRTTADIEYPETDGKPIAETELHLNWMFRLREILRWRYRGQRVYVGCNMLVYFEQGNPDECIAPDCFVAFDCEPRIRRTFRTWEEGKAPEVVFEITSRSTRREDERLKPAVYAEIGIGECFLYDPTADYLRPPLQGYRLVSGVYQRLEPDQTGAITSRLLGATLRLENGSLAFYDGTTGESLLTEAEAATRDRQKMETQLAAEKAARETAEDELAKLHAVLDRLRGQAD